MQVAPHRVAAAEVGRAGMGDRHGSNREGHRGVKQHPGGSAPGAGTVPGIAVSGVPGAPPGMEPSRPRV
jgi:hypothetical protein